MKDESLNILSLSGLTPDELSRLAASGDRGWISTDHVTWVSSQLNTMQQDTMVLCPNAVVNVANEMSRKSKLFNFGTLKRLALLVNVGKRKGQTFIGGISNSGNHWVLVVVELRPFKRIIYCDTLAWDPPVNILEVVNSFTNHIPRVGSYDSFTFCTAHSPLATSRRLGHVCDWRCRNYPFQTCSDICGVIALISAALAALDRSLFQYLIGPYVKETIYLQRPSQHSYYLRRVLMSWFAEGHIDIDYVLLQPGWRDNIPTKSDHSFCVRQDTAGNSKKNFKLSLGRRAPSSCESTSGTAQDHSPAQERSVPASSSACPATNTHTYVSKASNSFNGSPWMPGHSASPNAKSSPSSKKSPSAMKPHLPSKKSSFLNRKRPLLKSSSLSEKSKKFKHFSSEQPPTAKEARYSTPTCPSSSDRDDTCNSTSAATPQSKTATCSTQGSSRETPTSSTSDDDPCDQQSPSTEPPTFSATTTTSPQTESPNESSRTEPLPKVASRFQCQDCGLQLSSRQCLYKHKLRKHKTTNEDPKAKESNHVCPECTGKQSR